MLRIAKGALVVFWLLALVNLLQPFSGPYITWVAALMLLVHMLEIALLRTSATSGPALAGSFAGAAVRRAACARF
ncbi:DUF1145 domain-containing protein [Pseudomonas sp. PDM15]|uniref:DUF1145 domain-containing protein n=1 Tax=Pseudomonas sp. PDM15 TaxID=2769303 RepID=UPI001CE1EB5B|nr:DUF1145 domain-containing protein [Pseudomonas sp. PDM15]